MANLNLLAASNPTDPVQLAAPPRARMAVVSTYPPGGLPLNEYTWRMVAEFSRAQALDLVVLADILEGHRMERPAHNVEIRRCWRYNDVGNPARVLREVRALQPDVVWFNLCYSTFGDSRVPHSSA